MRPHPSPASGGQGQAPARGSLGRREWQVDKQRAALGIKLQAHLGDVAGSVQTTTIKQVPQ